MRNELENLEFVQKIKKKLKFLNKTLRFFGEKLTERISTTFEVDLRNSALLMKNLNGRTF